MFPISDPAKTRRYRVVTPTSAQYRTAGGTTENAPGIFDGNKATQGMGFYGRSYQFLYVVFSEPVDFIEITASNSARTGGCTVSYRSVRLQDDFRDVVPSGETKTITYNVARGAGTLAFNTGASDGYLTFYEVRGGVWE